MIRIHQRRKAINDQNFAIRRKTINDQNFAIKRIFGL